MSPFASGASAGRNLRTIARTASTAVRQKNASVLISMLSRGGALGGVVGSSKAV
jgi:hypothetical protein